MGTLTRISKRSSPADARETQGRSAREAGIYDEGRVWAASHAWHLRAHHVLVCSNTLRAENLFETLMKTPAVGGNVLDVGCGAGALSEQLRRIGARSVLGIDVSSEEINEARSRCAGLPGLRFEVHSAEAPIDGTFDLIVGRSVLHHIDFRRTLPMWFDQNLAPGGRMLFMEPMSHPLVLLFHLLVRSAHTPDEWPLTPADTRWLRETFAARVRPVNLLSFPAAAISSILFSSAENRLVRIADTIDQAVELRPRLAAHGRQGIILIDRPATCDPTS